MARVIAARWHVARRGRVACALEMLAIGADAGLAAYGVGAIAAAVLA